MIFEDHFALEPDYFDAILYKLIREKERYND